MEPDPKLTLTLQLDKDIKAVTVTAFHMFQKLSTDMEDVNGAGQISQMKQFVR